MYLLKLKLVAAFQLRDTLLIGFQGCGVLQTAQLFLNSDDITFFKKSLNKYVLRK